MGEEGPVQGMQEIRKGGWSCEQAWEPRPHCWASYRTLVACVEWADKLVAAIEGCCQGLWATCCGPGPFHLECMCQSQPEAGLCPQQRLRH